MNTREPTPASMLSKAEAGESWRHRDSRNAAGVNDGAATMIVASESAVHAHGLRPRALVMGMASSGVLPRIMGIGPVTAKQKLLAKLQLKLEDFGLIELNEAFASQAIASLRALGIPEHADYVNPNGGAIALGTPSA